MFNIILATTTNGQIIKLNDDILKFRHNFNFIKNVIRNNKVLITFDLYLTLSKILPNENILIFCHDLKEYKNVTNAGLVMENQIVKDYDELLMKNIGKDSVFFIIGNFQNLNKLLKISNMVYVIEFEGLLDYKCISKTLFDKSNYLADVLNVTFDKSVLLEHILYTKKCYS